MTELIKEGRAAIAGPIRQEVLSGIRDQSAFEKLRTYLRHFDDEEVETEDYEEAARITNVCRAAGISGSEIDFLLCAVAVRRNLPIFTTDADFERYAKHIPIRLHELRDQPG